MKATRHNGRSGKNGTYNPRHNDRRFDLENSEHIDAGRVRENIYWDCYRGYTTMQNREEDSQDISFEKIECTFYQEHYGKYIEAQNERNARTRHTERNRSVEDLLKNNKTCPEETIFQIGTVEESVSYPLFMEALEKISETEYLLDTLLSGTLEERVAVVVAHGKEVTAIEQRISDFITTDTTGIVRSNGYNGNGVDSRGNQRTTGNDTEGCCEKQSA